MPCVLSAMQRQWKTFVKTDGRFSPPPLNTNGKFKVQLMAGEPRNIWKLSLALNSPQRIHCYNSRTLWLWPNSERCEQSFHSLCFQPGRRTAEVRKNWDVAANMVFRIFEETCLTAVQTSRTFLCPVLPDILLPFSCFSYIRINTIWKAIMCIKYTRRWNAKIPGFSIKSYWHVALK